MGCFYSCNDGYNLIEEDPSWLGSSIYDYLKSNGNYTNVVRMIDDLGYADVLARTGSKTLFVADDEAYARFFNSRKWGVGSYEELSQSQKKMLLYGAMINNSCQVAYLSSSMGPTEGDCMRRLTSASEYDTVPILTPADMPDTKYWAYYKSAGKTIPCLEDMTTAPMIHFIEAYLQNRRITNDDCNFLFNYSTERQAGDANVNGVNIAEQNIRCSNGFVHKMAEVMKISDHITVIRRGKVIGTVRKDETNVDELTRMMVGRDVNLSRRERKEFTDQPNLLELKNVSYTVNKTVKKLDGINLQLKAGEVLGIAGVDGNGQEELAQAICGQITPDSGEILFKGDNIVKKGIRARKDSGIALVPEDRHRDGLVLQYSVADNLVLGMHYQEPYAHGRTWMDYKAIHKNAETLQDDFDIRCANVDVPAGTLSGGNQQKIVIAREASRNPDVLIAVQPTRGLDIGAMEFVQKTLLEQRDKGKGVLLFSLELDEILSVSDRIAVIFKGRIVDVVDAEGVTRQELGRMMLGSHRDA